jgi:hypothetical protein
VATKKRKPARREKRLPGIFWFGVVILYGYNLGVIVLEMTLGITYDGVGVAPQFVYVGFGSLILLNVFLAWLWVYLPERWERAEEEASRKESRHGR